MRCCSLLLAAAADVIIRWNARQCTIYIYMKLLVFHTKYNGWHCLIELHARRWDAEEDDGFSLNYSVYIRSSREIFRQFQCSVQTWKVYNKTKLKYNKDNTINEKQQNETTEKQKKRWRKKAATATTKIPTMAVGILCTRATHTHVTQCSRILC